MAYASPPPYYGFADAPSTPLRSFFSSQPAGAPFHQPSPSRHYAGHSRHASHDVSGNSSPGSSYPSPRYASNGRYATNTRIAPPFGDYTFDLNSEPFVFVNAQPRFEAQARYDDAPRKSRARAGTTSHSTPRRPTTSHGHQRPASAKKPPPPRQATPADAARANIPAGYSLRNWDPSETHILLLGSVFDANSLGKWIYDWTVFRHGPATPISDVAGELWLLLIKVAGKIRRGEEGLEGQGGQKIRRAENREVIIDFVESGENLMERLRSLLKACEGPMLRAGRKKGGEAVLGKNAGVEFVETLFGRERMLEETESFMTSCRLWSMRWDANCDEILRNPTA